MTTSYNRDISCTSIYMTNGLKFRLTPSPRSLSPLRGILGRASLHYYCTKKFKNTCILKVILLSDLLHIKFITCLDFEVQTIFSTVCKQYFQIPGDNTANSPVIYRGRWIEALEAQSLNTKAFIYLKHTIKACTILKERMRQSNSL